MSDETPDTTPTPDPFAPPPPGWQPSPNAPPMYAATPSPYAPSPYAPSPAPPSPYGPPPVGAPSQYEPATTPNRKMGAWALALCVASFIPLAWLIGVGLAIAALVRSSGGRDFGKKYAIAALVVAGIWVVGLVALAIPAGLEELEREVAAQDPSSNTGDAETASNTELHVGNCLNDEKLAGTSNGELVDATDVEPLACDRFHDFEVYHQFMLDHDEFPGDDAINAEATGGCKQAFKGFVGKSFNRSELFVYFYYPKESSWELANDRTVTCLVADSAGGSFGTLRGSKR